MKITIAILFILAIACSFKITQEDKIDLNRGLKLSHNLKNLIKQEKKDIPQVSDQPSEFSWNNVNGINYLTIVMNQNNPNYCGGSWAFAVTSALSDRIKIMRNAAWPDINLAPQVLLSCSYKDFGCIGGDPMNAYEYIQENTISDQTCSVYQAMGYEKGLYCSDELICGDCTSSKGCWAVDYYDSYTISDFAQLKGEQEMMDEIKNRGPITCTMVNTVELYEYKGGIFSQSLPTGSEANMAVSVVGWGEENGTPYWMVRNSNGDYWGENGYFRIQRGSNNLGIEDNCSYGVVKDTWTSNNNDKKENDKQEEKLDVKNLLNKTMENLKKQKTYKQSQQQENDSDLGEPCAIKKNANADFPRNVVKSPLPHEYLKAEDLPEEFDWRNVDGTNYMTWTVNQHIPRYCGSCWAQASSASLADRLNIQKKNAYPQQIFSVQSVVNCNGGGTCNGGWALELYKFVHENGIPPQSCQQYTARNPSVFECSDFQRCSNCLPTEFGQEICYPVEDYEKVYVSEYGEIEAYNHEAIKAEIYARGPISCTIYSTQAFHAYTGGIFAEYIPDAVDNLNHEIQVLGWGKSRDGIPYWIGRNSWGTYWGEQGYFKILADDNFNLAITSSCTWGVPSKEKP